MGHLWEKGKRKHTYKNSACDSEGITEPKRRPIRLYSDLLLDLYFEPKDVKNLHHRNCSAARRMSPQAANLYLNYYKKITEISQTNKSVRSSADTYHGMNLI